MPKYITTIQYLAERAFVALGRRACQMVQDAVPAEDVAAAGDAWRHRRPKADRAFGWLKRRHAHFDDILPLEHAVRIGHMRI